MAKPKAERWLTEAFAAGVDERDLPNFDAGPPPVVVPLVYAGANPACSLAQHDPVRRPCSGRFERFHFISRQRVENALWSMLLGAEFTPWVYRHEGMRGGPLSPASVNRPLTHAERWELILLAAWDPRNGGLGCEHHHRRFDAHAGSPSSPKIVVPSAQLPSHVYEFIDDCGFRGVGWLTERFPA